MYSLLCSSLPPRDTLQLALFYSFFSPHISPQYLTLFFFFPFLSPYPPLRVSPAKNTAINITMPKKHNKNQSKAVQDNKIVTFDSYCGMVQVKTCTDFYC